MYQVDSFPSDPAARLSLLEFYCRLKHGHTQIRYYTKRHDFPHLLASIFTYFYTPTDHFIHVLGIYPLLHQTLTTDLDD